jgi:hypothetical protein
LSTRALAILPAESSDRKQEDLAEGLRIWPCKEFLFILASDFTYLKILPHEAFGLNFLSKGRCAVDFYNP